ncbi:hypothetical protein LT85_3412 [Collimonas arenae]|uniref:Uncharacterized protein n=1 Tax=Collimonas arenae TaxID=279058 RepID=A0A0A1FFL0_9BURK|nr:hypothetical protein LT85_3412 [Collimonas arenae]
MYAASCCCNLNRKSSLLDFKQGGFFLLELDGKLPSNYFILD